MAEKQHEQDNREFSMVLEMIKGLREDLTTMKRSMDDKFDLIITQKHELSDLQKQVALHEERIKDLTHLHAEMRQQYNSEMELIKASNNKACVELEKLIPSPEKEVQKKTSLLQNMDLFLKAVAIATIVVGAILFTVSTMQKMGVINQTQYQLVPVPPNTNLIIKK